MWIHTAQQCQEIDRRATQDYGLPAMVLMERAGLAVFEAIQEMMPEPLSIGIICGKGNNGGDGFVVARLAHTAGYSVECIVTANPDELREECRYQMLQAEAQGVRIAFPSQPRWERVMACLGKFNLVVDAVLGIGAKGRVEGNVAAAIDAINRSGVPVISVDVPSGIDTDSGEELGTSVWALRTVTFGSPKPFLFQGIGLEHAGYWSVADIGYPRALKNITSSAQLLDKDSASSTLPERFKTSHKGTNGHLLIVAGSQFMIGAAIIAARAAYRSGIGLVTIASIPEVCRAVVQQVPEVVLIPLPEDQGTISPQAAEILLQHQSRFHGSLFGPGLTHNDNISDLFARLWPRWEVASVLDADALNTISNGLRPPPAPCVMTPHPGEMSRLLQTSVDEVQEDRFKATRAAVAKYEKTVLLKGPYSIVGSPHEPLSVNQTGNPGMASAGMGDALSGIIGTLIAQDIDPHEAAATGMIWHGQAGDLAAQEIAQIGYTATDLIEFIPKARSFLTFSPPESRLNC